MEGWDAKSSVNSWREIDDTDTGDGDAVGTKECPFFDLALRSSSTIRSADDGHVHADDDVVEVEEEEEEEVMVEDEVLEEVVVTAGEEEEKKVADDTCVDVDNEVFKG